MNTNKIVVDSSVAIKWFIPQNYSFEANKILSAYEANKLTLIAPDLIYAEIGNIVWKIQRFQGLNQEYAQNIIDLFQKIQINIISADELLRDAYDFAVKYLGNSFCHVKDELQLGQLANKTGYSVSAVEPSANFDAGRTYTNTCK